jgi:hypothetical protein
MAECVEASERRTIDLSNYASGFYFLEIEYDTGEMERIKVQRQ